MSLSAGANLEISGKFGKYLVHFSDLGSLEKIPC